MIGSEKAQSLLLSIYESYIRIIYAILETPGKEMLVIIHIIPYLRHRHSETVTIKERQSYFLCLIKHSLCLSPSFSSASQTYPRMSRAPRWIHGTLRHHSRFCLPGIIYCNHFRDWKPFSWSQGVGRHSFTSHISSPKWLAGPQRSNESSACHFTSVSCMALSVGWWLPLQM